VSIRGKARCHPNLPRGAYEANPDFSGKSWMNKQVQTCNADNGVAPSPSRHLGFVVVSPLSSPPLVVRGTLCPFLSSVQTPHQANVTGSCLFLFSPLPRQHEAISSVPRINTRQVSFRRLALFSSPASLRHVAHSLHGHSFISTTPSHLQATTKSKRQATNRGGNWPTPAISSRQNKTHLPPHPQPSAHPMSLHSRPYLYVRRVRARRSQRQRFKQGVRTRAATPRPIRLGVANKQHTQTGKGACSRGGRPNTRLVATPPSSPSHLSPRATRRRGPSEQNNTTGTGQTKTQTNVLKRHLRGRGAAH